MAKSTRSGGASFTPAEMADPEPPVIIRRAMLGGDPSLREKVGGDSSQSSENVPTSDENSGQLPRKPARSTESHSSSVDEQEEVVTVPGETTGTPKTDRESGDRSKRTAGSRSGPRGNSKRAGVRSTDDELDEFGE